jgi:hypothetical protein
MITVTITTQKTTESRWEMLSGRVARWAAKVFTVGNVGIVLVVMSVVIGTFGYVRTHGSFAFDSFLQEFYANISSELGSVAITVLIIDRLNQRRQREEEKARLIRQMGNKVNGIALQAVEDLRALDAIKDGSLMNINLEEANLQGVRLGRVDLRNARLDFANLSGGHLFFANLERADMSGVNFSGAVLTGANLRYADLVAADLRGTLLSEADLSHAKLDRAQFDDNTQLPDKTNWRKGVDMTRFTDPTHPNYWRSEMPESFAYQR